MSSAEGTGAGAQILGVHLGKGRERAIGLSALVLYLVILAIIWSQDRTVRDATTAIAILAGPLLILLSARIIAAIQMQDRAFPWVSPGGGEAPPPEVEGWHVSRDMGIAVVSLRSGTTVWINLRYRSNAARVPAWLRGPTQWGVTRFGELPLPVGAEWVAPAIPAALALTFLGIKGIDVNGRFHWDLVIVFFLLGPFAGIGSCLGTLLAILWYPSMELEGETARVLFGGRVPVAALRAEVRGSLSGSGQLELTETRPSGQGRPSRRRFRPAAMLSSQERFARGFNEAEVIRRILEERARPQESVYRVQALEREPNGGASK